MDAQGTGVQYDFHPSAEPTPSSTDELYDRKKLEFKEYFAENIKLLQAAEKSVRNLVQQLVDVDEFELPKVTSRLKDRDECIRKFGLKYRTEAEKEGDYDIVSKITDLIGVRIIALYETDIPKIAAIIQSEFQTKVITDKSKALAETVNSFGYKGLHFDVKLTDERCNFSEYKRFHNLRFEIQIRSIVQDAWSEVEHRLRYKKQAPVLLYRRISRLAALFELADQEFSALQDETQKLEIEAVNKKDDEIQRNANNVLDSLSFLSVVSKIHPNYRFESRAIDGFVDEVMSLKPNFSIRELNTAIKRFRQHVWDYKQYQRTQQVNVNPFTEIRFTLYMHDKEKFADMLYPNQRANFVNWMKDQKGITV